MGIWDGTQAPARFTPPLSDQFPNDWDLWLGPLIRLVYRTQEDPSKSITLDRWQEQLLRCITERYPQGHPKAGQLRFRQAMVSIGRQNGKSVLAAILGIWGLINFTGGNIVGVASSADQARIVFQRVLHVIRNSSKLSKKFKRLNEGVRGIESANGSTYQVKASKGGALQGIPVALGLIDEAHIAKPELWQSLINGAAARPEALVLTITTAGDQTSTLLLSLYETADKAIADPREYERFGAWIWEAPEAAVPKDQEALNRYIHAANPSIAEGRVDVSTVLEDLKATPEQDILRYRLNRFVQSASSWIPSGAWLACKGEGVDPQSDEIVFSFDRTPNWEHAAVTATTALDGQIRTELVASLNQPSPSRLVALAKRLHERYPYARFAMDKLALGDVGAELTDAGVDVYLMSLSDVTAACAFAYSAIAQKQVSHVDDPLVRLQMPMAQRKNVGEQWRITRGNQKGDVDAVLATVTGIYVAARKAATKPQLF